jgi:hypothetical protein
VGADAGNVTAPVIAVFVDVMTAIRCAVRERFVVIPRFSTSVQDDAARERLGFCFGARLGTCPARDVRVLAVCVPPATRHRAVIEPDGVAQRIELGLRQLAGIADPQVVKRQVGERHALQLVDLESDRLDHPVDLAVLALVDRDAQPRMLALAGQRLDLGRHRDRAVIERDSFAQGLEVFAPELAVYLDVVRLRHVARRREQPRRQLAIVGQQQHALGVEVEAAHRLHRDRHVRQIVHHRRPPAIVADRGDARLRLVQQHVEVIERDDRFTVDQHRVVHRIDLGAEHRHDLAVHLDPARGDQVFGLAPRRDARGG